MEESQEELMERVKNMSPEELAEFQKSRCIFCQIIAGKVQSKKVYEDNKIIAILVPFAPNACNATCASFFATTKRWLIVSSGTCGIIA
jgi:hypothetical protein